MEGTILRDDGHNGVHTAYCSGGITGVIFGSGHTDTRRWAEYGPFFPNIMVCISRTYLQQTASFLSK